MGRGQTAIRGTKRESRPALTSLWTDHRPRGSLHAREFQQALDQRGQAIAGSKVQDPLHFFGGLNVPRQKLKELPLCRSRCLTGLAFIVVGASARVAARNGGDVGLDDLSVRAVLAMLPLDPASICTITGGSAHAPNVIVNGPYTLTAWVQQGSGLVDHPREWPGLGSNGRTAASEQVLRGSDRAW